MYFRMFVLYQNRSITEATTAEAIPKCIVLQYVSDYLHKLFVLLTRLYLVCTVNVNIGRILTYKSCYLRGYLLPTAEAMPKFWFCLELRDIQMMQQSTAQNSITEATTSEAIP